MNFLIIILLLFISYIFGSFPSGYIIAKHIKKVDIRKHGSHSTGATNTTRVLGIKYGLLALSLDAIKGVIVMFLLTSLNLKEYYIVNIFNEQVNILAVYGLFAVIGHVFPVFLSFKGGKAVATSFGIVLFLNWWLALIGVVILVLVVYITKYVSLGSIITAISLFIISILFSIFNVEIFNKLIPLEYAIVYGVLSIIIILKHKENIVRLINKTESKFNLKK